MRTKQLILRFGRFRLHASRCGDLRQLNVLLLVGVIDLVGASKQLNLQSGLMDILLMLAAG